MPVGLLVVIAFLAIGVAYYVGMSIGIHYTDSIWRQWLAEQISFKIQKIKVEDLYPKKDNESN